MGFVYFGYEMVKLFHSENEQSLILALESSEGRTAGAVYICHRYSILGCIVPMIPPGYFLSDISDTSWAGLDTESHITEYVLRTAACRKVNTSECWSTCCTRRSILAAHDFLLSAKSTGTRPFFLSPPSPSPPWDEFLASD